MASDCSLKTVTERGHQHPAAGSAWRGQDSPVRDADPQSHREGPYSLLRAGLRPDGGPDEDPGRVQPGPRMKVYLAPKVLMVDEFGIWPYDRDSAIAFFTPVSGRYERVSIILTPNKGFCE